MKRSRAHTIIPAIVMTAAAAVPIITTVDILTSVASARPGAGIAPSLTTSSASGTSRTYTGPSVSDPFGNVQAAVAVAGKRIVDVAITAPMNNQVSSTINSQAIPLLRQETLQAQSANVNVVSGATYTSQAYLQSLQSAIAQANLGGAASTSAPASNSGAQAGAPSSVAVSGGDN
jgi:uncharacterized protein with FMN-binding domain